MNLLSKSWIHQEITWYFAYKLWFHYLFHDFDINSLSNRGFIMHSVSVPRIQFISPIYPEITFVFANSPSIPGLNYEFTFCVGNSLPITLIYNEFTIYFNYESISTMNSLSFSRIQYLFREFTIYTINLDSLSISRKYHELTICFAITL